MEKDLISVILPVWKPDIKQLKECLDSLVKQTYSKIEIIISYRESPEHNDTFYHTVNEYADNRIKVIIENQGFQKQLNEGVLNSKGEYIARIDGDDFCEINRFEKQLQYKKNHKCNIVGSWARYISNEGREMRDLKLPVTHNEIRKKIIFFDPILHPSVLMDKKMIEELGYYDTSFLHAEDYELWLRAMSKGYRFGNVPEYLVKIRHNPESLTRGKTWRIAKMYALKAKKKAIFQYGFNKPQDIFYYLVSLVFLPISPQIAIKINRILRRHEV